MDLFRATDEELRAELDGAQQFLGALMSGTPLGSPFEGREEAKEGRIASNDSGDTIRTG